MQRLLLLLPPRSLRLLPPTISPSEMPRLHGNKRYYQILLDPDKAEVIDEQATKEKVRATALIRKWIYERLTNAPHHY